jgi:hypothetical protein
MIDLPRSTYYYRSTARALNLGDRELVAIIEDIQDELPCYGYRRVTHELQRRGHLVKAGISSLYGDYSLLDNLEAAPVFVSGDIFGLFGAKASLHSTHPALQRPRSTQRETTEYEQHP